MTAIVCVGFRKLLRENSVTFSDALFTAVELNCVDVLQELLVDVKDINMRHEDTGLGLLHKAAASGKAMQLAGFLAGFFGAKF